MIRKNRKGTTAHLLLEILVCSAIFLIITVFLFGAHAPKQLLRLHAHVESADAALSCELCLANLLRGKSSQGITYSDWLADSYSSYHAGTSDAMNSWKNELKTALDKVFYAGNWSLNASLPNGTRILTTGGVSAINKNIRDCVAFVPFPDGMMKSDCFFEVSKSPDTDSKVEFETPEDEDVICEVIITTGTADMPGKIGIKTRSGTCKLDLTAKEEFEETLQSSIENDPDITDSITLPIYVKNVPYEITVEETEEEEKALVTLARRTLLRDCALNVTLQTVL